MDREFNGTLLFLLASKNEKRLLVNKALIIATLRGETGFGDLMSGPGQCSRHQPLMLEVVDSEDVGDDHDHHGDVESEEGAEDEKVLVVHLAHAGLRHGYQESHIFFLFFFSHLRHDVLHVEEGQDGDGRGQEQAQPPGQDHLCEQGLFC